MSHHPRSRQLTLSPHFRRSPNVNTSNELKKDAATVESNIIQPWHKSAPWLISAATILGLIVILQR
jgi:hypothetical protein